MKNVAVYAPEALQCETRRLEVIQTNFEVHGIDLRCKCFCKEKNGHMYVYAHVDEHEFPIPVEVARRLFDRDYDFKLWVEIRKTVDQFGHVDSTYYHVDILNK